MVEQTDIHYVVIIEQFWRVRILVAFEILLVLQFSFTVQVNGT